MRAVTITIELLYYGVPAMWLLWTLRGAREPARRAPAPALQSARPISAI